MKNPTASSALRPQAPARRALAALAACSALALGACLQTDPDSPDPKQDTEIPQDETRRAGTSSSTNWPPDVGKNRIQIHFKAEKDLRLTFDTVQLLVNLSLPVDFTGSIGFYKAGVIPALEAPVYKEIRVQSADTLVIPGSFLDTLWNVKGDTLKFNILFKTDSTEAWLHGFSWSKSSDSLVTSPLPPKSGESPYLRHVNKYFEGNLKVDTAVITPSTGNSEFSFYIPGTPIFGSVQVDSHFRIGPMPFGEYPLRLLRLTRLPGNPGETLVEVWEAPIDKVDSGFTLTPGAKVFSARTQGTLNLRKGE